MPCIEGAGQLYRGGATPAMPKNNDRCPVLLMECACYPAKRTSLAMVAKDSNLTARIVLAKIGGKAHLSVPGIIVSHKPTHEPDRDHFFFAHEQPRRKNQQYYEQELEPALHASSIPPGICRCQARCWDNEKM